LGYDLISLIVKTYWETVYLIESWCKVV